MLLLTVIRGELLDAWQKRSRSMPRTVSSSIFNLSSVKPLQL